MPQCGALGVNGLSGHLTELCGLQVACWNPLPSLVSWVWMHGLSGHLTELCGLLGVSWSPASLWCPGCGCVVCQDTSLWTPGCQLEPCLIVVSRVWMRGLSGHLTVDSWVSVGALPHCGVLGVNGLSGHLTELCGLRVSCWSAVPQFGVLGVNMWSFKTLH